MEFDVFLSHNSKDKPAVRELARRLAARSIRVWLDAEQLIPGRNWQPLLEQGIEQSNTSAVVVGKDGLGPWEDEEMQSLLRQAVTSGKPVIPVLLPRAPKKPKLPLFLTNRTWVDLRKGFTDQGMDRLVWGITGMTSGDATPADAKEKSHETSSVSLKGFKTQPEKKSIMLLVVIIFAFITMGGWYTLQRIIQVDSQGDQCKNPDPPIFCLFR